MLSCLIFEEIDPAISGSIVATVNPKSVVVMSSILAGFGSLVFPFLIERSFIGACLVRFAMGISHAPLMPALQAMLIPWAPHHESAKFFFVQRSGCMIGSFGTFFAGGPFM